jgi:hypothetical protein
LLKFHAASDVSAANTSTDTNDRRLNARTSTRAKHLISGDERTVSACLMLATVPVETQGIDN